MSNFVFMLTHSDSTIDRALDVVGELSGTGLHYVGFKDVGATPERQRAIAAGSVVEDAQIEMLAFAGASFTIGSATVDGLFLGDPDVASQVRHVLEVARRAGGAASDANRRS